MESSPYAVRKANIVACGNTKPRRPRGRFTNFPFAEQLYAELVRASAAFLFAIAGLTVTYLLLAQGAKWAFYRLWSPAGAVPAPLIRAPLPLIGRS